MEYADTKTIPGSKIKSITMGKKIKKILFYTNELKVFRATQLGHLYEIAQDYPVVLLSEKLDVETEKVISDKKLFPKLEAIIPAYQEPGRRQNIFSEIRLNREIHALAKKIILKYRPDILIAPTDIHSLLEMYLFRMAKKEGVLKIVMQPSNIGNNREMKKWVDLINAHLRFPNFLPLSLRIILVRIRKYIGNFFYLYFLPLLVSEKPFSNKVSYILRTGNIGMGDSDYLTVFSQRDRETLLREGVNPKKIYILSHPMSRAARKIFKRAYLNLPAELKQEKKPILVLLSNVEASFTRKGYSLIKEGVRYEEWKKAISIIASIFPYRKIIIKPHPRDKNIDRKKEFLGFPSKSIEILGPEDSLEKYVGIGSIIVGFPLSASTSLFSAYMQCPEKPILSLDFHQEILGDYYKDFDGIDYISDEKEFAAVLQSIKDNKYRKKSFLTKKGDFSNAAEMLEILMAKRNQEKLKK